MPRGIYERGEFSKPENCTGGTEEQFWRRVDKNGPYPSSRGRWKLTTRCWIWIGAKLRSGYGQYRGTKAHRVSYSLLVEPATPDVLVLHKCDNPSCVNPDHLFIGSPQDNMDDKVEKGRWSGGRPSETAQGELNPKAKLTGAQVIQARKLYSEGISAASIAIMLDIKAPIGTLKGAIKKRTWRHI